MTEDSKQRLLKYLTGTIDIGEKSSIPINNFEVTNNLYTYIRENITTYHFYYTDVISSNSFENRILYGYWVDSSDQYKEYSALIILDANFNPVGNITTYDSGTPLSRIDALEFDEDNYLYGIDLTNNDNRFIMLSNPLATTTGEYKLKLRKSYYFGNNTNLKGIVSVVQKVQNEPVYIFGGNNATGYNCLTTLKIEVGSTNEWHDYVGTIANEIAPIYIFYTYSSGNFTELGAINTNSPTDQGCLIRSTVSGNSLADSRYYVGEFVFIYNLACKNKNEVYLTAVNDDEGYFIVGKYDFTNKSLTILVSPPHIADRYATSLKALNNIAVMAYDYIEDDNYYETLYFIDADDNVAELTIPIPTPYSYELEAYITCNYNLFNIYTLFPNHNDAEVYQIVYNSNNNYNGGEYEDYGSLFPVYGTFLDNNNKYLFARNLYNKSILGSTTTSIVEIPNTMVNDVSIDSKNLMSDTNTEIVHDSEQLVKNVYETLYINFINRISMKNDITGELSDTGAIRLNTSTTSTLDYENARLGKYRINYANDTTFTSGIGEAVYNSTTKKVVLKFNIYVKSQIESIDLISNDETTVYNTITELSDGSNVSDFVTGNYYLLSQTVEIGE